MVKTHYFNNSRSLLSNGECCEVGKSGSCAVQGCDSYFEYCLWLRWQVRRKEGYCTTSQVNYNGAEINLSAPHFLGLPNPLSLPGPAREWTPGVS